MQRLVAHALALPGGAAAGCNVVLGYDEGSPLPTDAGSGGAAVPCNEDPRICPAGQTCWVQAEGEGWECLNSGRGVVGEECFHYFGTPTCQDDLGCYQPFAVPFGECMPYCDPTDPSHGCPGGEMCLTMVIPDAGAIQICQP